MKNQKVTVMKLKIKILPNEKQRRPSKEKYVGHALTQTYCHAENKI